MPDLPAECGVTQPRIQKRIIGGHEASYGELPWQTHIRILGYQCGGVLVTRIHVVTAAHCVHRSVHWDTGQGRHKIPHWPINDLFRTEVVVDFALEHENRG